MPREERNLELCRDQADAPANLGPRGMSDADRALALALGAAGIAGWVVLIAWVLR